MVPAGGPDGKRLVVVAFDQTEFRTWADAARFQKFQQMPVALVNPAHPVALPGLRLGEQAADRDGAGCRGFPSR